MPHYLSYLIDFSLWLRMLPPIVVAAIIALILLYVSKENSDNKQSAFLVIFSMTLLGVIAGVTTGQSRAPAVGAVVPAVLSIASVLMIYIVAGKGRAQQTAASVVLTGFLICFFIGIHFGSASRNMREEFLISEQYLIGQAAIAQNVALENVKYEAQIKKLRNILELE